MSISLFGIWEQKKNVAPTLVKVLQSYQSQNGTVFETGLATSAHWLFQHTQGTWQTVLAQLKKQPLHGLVGIAYAYQSDPDEEKAPLSINERLALVLDGTINNITELRDDLWRLGYEDVDQQTDSEIVLLQISRYSELAGIPLPDALLITVNRLQGDFAIMAVEVSEESLIAAQRGNYQLALGVREETIYISSNVEMLKTLGARVMQLKGRHVVLHSAN
jgi:glucosamine 6-phosphate synthetase-like amidotransferase/phosphosugar isomerase protein